ncbi:MAG TPA: WecB/TagA/CpsF family glycosyltransferase [Acetobacteraceae bacterium]|nr:WecB/TagA/CpsF family glycosyltransferase [Acetobacteraceae bacterium]
MSAAPIFGFAPSPLRAREIAGLVAGRVRAPGEGVGLVVTANIDHVRHLGRDPDFAAAYRAAEIVTCDGFPVQAYAWLRGWRKAGRVTGCDIMAWLMRHERLAPGHRPFFVLDSPATAAVVRAWAARRGVADVAVEVAPPGFGEDEAAARTIAWRIAAHGATLLVMGVGAPRSEVFVERHRAVLPPCWALCIGQAVRIETGLTRRAPRWLRGLNLEWAWRLGQEPRRLARRYALASVAFLRAVAGDWAGEKARPGLRPGPAGAWRPQTPNTFWAPAVQVESSEPVRVLAETID